MKSENLNRVKYIVMERKDTKKKKRGVPWKLNMKSESTVISQP